MRFLRLLYRKAKGMVLKPYLQTSIQLIIKPLQHELHKTPINDTTEKLDKPIKSYPIEVFLDVCTTLD